MNDREQARYILDKLRAIECQDIKQAIAALEICGFTCEIRASGRMWVTVPRPEYGRRTFSFSAKRIYWIVDPHIYYTWKTHDQTTASPGDPPAGPKSRSKKPKRVRGAAKPPRSRRGKL